MTDEQTYWTSVREMAKTVEEWVQDGYPEDTATWEVVIDHLEQGTEEEPELTRVRAIRWTENLNAIEELGWYSIPEEMHYETGEASQAIFAIAQFAMMADVRKVMEANEE